MINEQEIYTLLENQKATTDSQLDEVIAEARKLKGLNNQQILTLIQANTKEQLAKIFETANYVKDEIYGNRLVLFAPMYVSNKCSNDCIYCGFRATNKDSKRRSLEMNEIANETRHLINDGHKRVLLVAGESAHSSALGYIKEAISTIYATKTEKGNIRRINVNIAPLSVDGFKELAQCKIGTYQLFQETYHRETYKKAHLKGPKTDYDFRLSVMDRAMQGGIDDVGIGVLFGLYDWRFELMALFEHVRHLERAFGVGPHTISVPRLEPAEGVDLNNFHLVNDQDFKKIIAIIRLAVPYTGIILSTRESKEMRQQAFNLGVSQISAGSKTNPGGYEEERGLEQFSLGDHRSLHEVIEDVVDHKHIPSFCTGCYRLGRVGADFMDLAKPGLIKSHCMPNAIFTFAEYLEDFAQPTLYKKGYDLISEMVISNPQKSLIETTLKKIQKEGKRDLYL